MYDVRGLNAGAAASPGVGVLVSYPELADRVDLNNIVEVDVLGAPASHSLFWQPADRSTTTQHSGSDE